MLVSRLALCYAVLQKLYGSAGEEEERRYSPARVRGIYQEVIKDESPGRYSSGTRSKFTRASGLHRRPEQRLQATAARVIMSRRG